MLLIWLEWLQLIEPVFELESELELVFETEVLNKLILYDELTFSDKAKCFLLREEKLYLWFLLLQSITLIEARGKTINYTSSNRWYFFFNTYSFNFKEYIVKISKTFNW